MKDGHPFPGFWETERKCFVGHENVKARNDNKKRDNKALKFQMDGVPRIAGPSCLKCGEPIDVRPGAGGEQEDGTVNLKGGSRRVARNGFLHTKCEEESIRKPDELFRLAIEQGFVPLESLDA
jgi:hypothetical protein